VNPANRKLNKQMKTTIKTTIATLSLLAFGLIASSCSDMTSANTHEMGPPGKTRAMPDSQMPSMAR
jgi:hypothetical protein